METAIIIEDEIPAGKRLERILSEKGLEVLAVLRSVREVIQWLATHHEPDLIFMDVHLQDGLCFRIPEQVPLAAKIIFTTAFDHYALRAFDYNSVDYLLKPIDETKLDKAIQKYRNFSGRQQTAASWKSLEASLNEPYRQSMLVAIGSKLKKILTAEVVCFYSENNSTYLFAENGRTYPISASLEKLSAELHPDQFFRISRKFLLHKKYIREINGKLVVLQVELPGFELKVSGLRRKAFVAFLKK